MHRLLLSRSLSRDFMLQQGEDYIKVVCEHRRIWKNLKITSCVLECFIVKLCPFEN